MFCIRPLEGCFVVHVLFAARSQGQPHLSGPGQRSWGGAGVQGGGGGLSVLEEWARPSRAEWAWSWEIPPRPA